MIEFVSHRRLQQTVFARHAAQDHALDVIEVVEPITRRFVERGEQRLERILAHQPQQLPQQQRDHLAALALQLLHIRRKLRRGGKDGLFLRMRSELTRTLRRQIRHGFFRASGMPVRRYADGWVSLGEQRWGDFRECRRRDGKRHVLVTMDTSENDVDPSPEIHLQNDAQYFAIDHAVRRTAHYKVMILNASSEPVDLTIEIAAEKRPCSFQTLVERAIRRTVGLVKQGEFVSVGSIADTSLDSDGGPNG